MSEEKKENERNRNETGPEPLRNLLEKAEEEIQKNLETLEALRKVRGLLEQLLTDARARKGEADGTGAERGTAAGERPAETGDDPLYKDAAELVRTEGRVSTSLLQRRFSIGYGHAKKLIERMAAEGITEEIPEPKRFRIIKPDGQEE